MLTKFIAVSETRFQNTETTPKTQQASIQGIESQLGQLAKLISEIPQGSLPSNTETNPREQIQAITTQDSEGLDEPNFKQENSVEEGKVEMPNSRKFLKKLLTNKRRIDEASHVELNAMCSAVLQNRLPQKLKDPGSFTIPCLIGSLSIDNALADSGASINVMPYKMLKQLGLGKPKKTRMRIQLADKTIRILSGIIKDVLVKVDKFIFPVDFFVLDMDDDNTIPLILGRPFLATARTRIDVDAGELILCNTTEPDPRPRANKEITQEERRFQIDELDEWKMHFKEKLRIHEAEPKPLHETDKFKIIDQSR
ncbi:Retrovirus-related Pol polyprotein from transposon 17.6 [Gossypium australe]|uniref:Retrovirus-related Pol polyprotein from transposon 17.6 n=1 Tax=Gossypium australe TaxID=47621 RepID=A0A5B6WDD9_9ROSI|nr:Retrovirus-related Pol polyprotein from transposon 17.6 [Gossypium australe]